MKKLLGILTIYSLLFAIFLIIKDYKANDLNKGYYIAQSYFFIVLFFISIITFFCKKNLQIYFLLITSSLFVAFYSFEFYLFKSGGMK